SIRKAAKIMRDDDIGAIPVVDQIGELVGLVTDRDIVVRAVAQGKDLETPLQKVMSKDPKTVGADTPIAEATYLMSSQQIRRLVVVENGRVTGMISLGDVATSAAPDHEKAKTLSEVSVDTGALRTSPNA